MLRTCHRSGAILRTVTIAPTFGESAWSVGVFDNLGDVRRRVGDIRSHQVYWPGYLTELLSVYPTRTCPRRKSPPALLNWEDHGEARLRFRVAQNHKTIFLFQDVFVPKDSPYFVVEHDIFWVWIDSTSTSSPAIRADCSGGKEIGAPCPFETRC